MLQQLAGAEDHGLTAAVHQVEPQIIGNGRMRHMWVSIRLCAHIPRSVSSTTLQQVSHLG
eukprot:1091136-Amphidinium_carterae.1